MDRPAAGQEVHSSGVHSSGVHSSGVQPGERGAGAPVALGDLVDRGPDSRGVAWSARSSRAASHPGSLTKVLYGVGQIAEAVKMVLFGLFILFFYTTVMGLPGTLVGIAAGIGLVWDAVVDPYIGHASDRARLSFGRRHSFMLVGAATVGLTFWALFSPPQGLPTTMLFAWFLVTSLLARLASSCFVVPYHALGAELSFGYQERTALTGVRGACGLIGALATAGLSFAVFFPNVVPGQDPKLNYAGYPAMGLVFGLVMSLAALLATVGTWQWRPSEYGASDSARPAAPRPSANPISSWAAALRNASFRSLLLASSLVFVGMVMSNTLLIHFLTYYVEISESRSLSVLQIALYAGSLAGIPFWIGISRVVEKRPLFIAAAASTALLMLGAFFLFGKGRLFGTGDVWPFLVGQIVAGFTTSPFWMLPASMLADVADEDALTTGHRREGVFFGLFSFGQQLAAGLSVLVGGVLLDWYAGLAPGQGQQSALTVQRIAVLFGLLPAGCLAAGALVTTRYALNRRRVAAIQVALARESAPSVGGDYAHHDSHHRRTR